jgi:uncharacterized ferredoxin-like protein
MDSDPVSIGEDGAIFWRGAYRSTEDAERLAEHFERIAEDHDWFEPIARDYAQSLRNAIAIQEDSYA